jgi:hypothetical protein
VVYNVSHLGFVTDRYKIFMFYNKFCISSGKCVFIIVKTKYVNSVNISISDSVINSILLQITHILPQMTHFITKHTYIL